jgi:protein CpxP
MTISGQGGGWMENATAVKPACASVVSAFNPTHPMKNTRLCLFLVLATTLSSLPALRAGDTPSPAGERREKMKEGGDRMAEALGLNEDQKAKMKALFEQEKAELDALRAGASDNKEALKGQAQEIRKKYREQRLALMTPEQRVKAEEMRGKMEKRGDRMEKREKPGT